MHIERQLPNEAHPLNDQQMEVIKAVVADRANTIVRAKAGAGKTSTLEAIARRVAETDPDTRILYVAFNKSVAVEARARMPRNVLAKTGHALAWGWAGSQFTEKVITPNGRTSNEVKFLRKHPGAVAKELKCSLTVAAKAMAVVDRFATSDDDAIGPQHFVQADGTSVAQGLRPEAKRMILGKARTYWADITTPLGHGQCRFKATFDHLRKMWALSRPDLTAMGADIIFLDEAQDTPPVLAKVVADQPCQTVIVGDSEQAIYEWAGSKDYLDKAEAEVSLPLATSYRFGPEIAATANRFLRLLGSTDEVIGAIDGDQVTHLDAPDAILTRSNAGMLTEIVEQQRIGRTVGVLEGTRTDLLLLAEHACWLDDQGPKPKRLHEILERYSSINEVLLADAEGDLALASVQTMLKNFSATALRRAVERLVPVKEASRLGRADLLVVTAHKAKGLEWDSVRIGPDFKAPRRGKDGKVVMPGDEELRLAYVAVTRAKRNLDPGSLDWIFDRDWRRVEPSRAA